MKDSFLREHSLWLLAIIPLFTNFVGNLVFPDSPVPYYLYFGLCFVLLFWDLYVQRQSGGLTILALLMGLLVLPVYLTLFRRGHGWQVWGPLLAWTVVFVFFLSVVSIGNGL